VTGRRESWQVRWKTPDGKHRSKNFRLKRDADRFARNTQTDIERGEWVDPKLGLVALSEVLESWQRGKLNRRPSTKARDESVIRKHIVPAFGDRPLASIQPADVRSWVARLKAAGYSSATIRKAAQLLSACLEAAVDDGLIVRNPARRIDLPKVERREMRFLSPDEITQVADAVPDRYRVLVLTAGFTGARWGELAGLKVERLDMLRRTMTIDQQLVEVKGKVSLADVKTSSARRQVTLPRFLVTELANHMATYPATNGHLVFTASNGHPLRRTNFRRNVWLPGVAASVGHPCRFHDLRHSHAAMLIAQNEHPKVMQNRLGHSSIRVTLDTYGHLFPGMDEAVADRLDAAFGIPPADTTRTPAAGNVVPLPRK
jgi:integrase